MEKLAVTSPPPDERADSKGWPRRFTGKVAVVTGASDRGIGGAIAERLVREGAAVLLLSRTRPERLLKRLGRLAGDYFWQACDIRHGHAVASAIDAGHARFGQFDVVVNNAGVEIARPFEELGEDDWEQIIGVNLTGAVRVTRQALPHLTAPGGAIVNISSVLGMAGCPGLSAYSATKAGLIGMTQSLAWELAPRGIRAVCVAPALVHTPLVHKHTQHLTQEKRAQIAACHPLDVGTGHDVAAAVAFLASDEARWITGITLPLGWANSYPLPVEQFLRAHESLSAQKRAA